MTAVRKTTTPKLNGTPLSPTFRNLPFDMNFVEQLGLTTATCPTVALAGHATATHTTADLITAAPHYTTLGECIPTFH